MGSGSVAVVLTGAAARGSFQAGALAELLPVLAGQGLLPRVWVGTSAGSISAALAAAHLHDGPSAAASALLDTWSQVDDDAVFRFLPLTIPSTALRYAAGFTVGLGSGVTSLLDTSPLQRTVADSFPAQQLAANLRAGVVAAVGAVATWQPSRPESASASGHSVVFLDEHHRSGYSGDAARGLEVVRGPLMPSHVLASSAIPVAFPAVKVEHPRSAAGWYVDGGVRLNAPLQPAIGLGADRIVVVSATSTERSPARGPGGAPEPDIADAAAGALTAVLGDRLVEDLRALRRTNHLLQQTGRLTTPGGRAYRRIEVMVVAPRPGEMAALAARVFTARTRGLGRLREVDNRLLGRFLRGAGDAAGQRELLSYLFFDREYMAAAIELGRTHARRALAGGWET